MEQMQQMVEATPFISAPQIRDNLNLDCCVNTIRRHLHRNDIHCRKPARKIDLTEEHARARLHFARDNLQRDWTNVIFSDEKVFCTAQDSRKHLWRIDGTRYDPRHILRNRRSGRISMAFWGWMSAAGSGELVPINTRMDAEEYIRILEDVMLPSVRILYPAPARITFVHDNSAVHTSVRVRDWFHNHPEVELLPWPSKSPDLNPIENLWATMGNIWENNNIRNRENLHAHVIQTWEALRGRQICENLVASMHRRLNDTINHNGLWTRY